MNIHLVRHAEAIERTPTYSDDHRFLTRRGRSRFRRVAATLRKCGVDPDGIVTSPLIRAVQTADILAEVLNFSGEIIVHPALSCGFRYSGLREIIESYSSAKELVLVGHEPDLGLLVGEMLDISPCTLKKGAVVALKTRLPFGEQQIDFLWLVTGGGKLVIDFDAARGRLTGAEEHRTEG